MTTSERSRPNASAQTEFPWMSSQVDSPVRMSVSPERAPDSTVNDRASGANITASLAKSGRRGASSKMLQPFALADWTKFSGGSLRSGMMRNGIAYPLPPSAHLTDGTGYGLLPTPVVPAGGGSSRSGARIGEIPTLEGMARANKWPPAWPTPRSEDGESTGMSAARLATREPDNLPTAVRLWPTPAARDYRHPNDPNGASRLSRPPTSGMQLPNAVGGVLNPDWVEKLMGFPVTWTELDQWNRGKVTPPAP